MREGLPDNNVCVRGVKNGSLPDSGSKLKILALSRAERIHLGRLIDNANTMG